MTQILKKILGDTLDQKLKAYLVGGAFKSLFLQMSTSLLTFGTSVVIARLSGAEGFGIYTLVFTWVSVLAILATLGLDDLMLKQLGWLNESKQYASLRGLLVWSNGLGLVSGVVVSMLFLGIIYLFRIEGLYVHRHFFWVGVWAIPCYVLLINNQAALRGLQHIGSGQLAEKTVQPFLFFLLLVGAYWGFESVTDLDIIYFRVGSFVGAMSVALWLLWTKVRPYWSASRELKIESVRWLKQSRYFALLSLLYLLNTRLDLLFLGVMVEEKALAYYNVALKFTDITLIPFMVLSAVLTPLFASLYKKKDIAALQKLYKTGTRISFVVVTLAVCGLVLFGRPFMRWFGDDFVQAYPVLLILCGVKLAHVFIGPANYLLMMIGLERAATWIQLEGVLLTAFAHIVLIPRFGIEGAAWATLLGLLWYEYRVARLAWKKGGIRVSIL